MTSPLFLRRFARPALIMALVVATLSTMALLHWRDRGMHAINGDEPHYLVIADGLLPRLELEQTGPYSRELSSHTISRSTLVRPTGPVTGMDSHVVRGPHGMFNVHNLGLPILLSVPYLLAGELGARLAMILLGALVILVLGLLLEELGASRRSQWISLVPLSVGLPFVPASTQIYPDLPAGLLCLVGLLAIARPSIRSTRVRLVAIGAVVGFLPWLHIRNAAPMAVITGALLLTIHRRGTMRRDAPWILAPMALGGALLIAYNWYAFGNLAGPYDSGAVQASTFTVMHLAGLLSDQNQGLFLQQPLHLVGLWWLRRLFRESRLLIGTSVAAGLSILAVNSSHWSLYGGWSFNGRFGWTAAACFSVVTVIALSRLFDSHPRTAIWMVLGGLAIQLRFLLGIFVQNKSLLPHLVDSWPGTYSVFWRPFESALPRWTSTSDAFTRVPNVVAIILLVLIALIGGSALTRKNRVRLVALTTFAAIAACGVVGILDDSVPTPRQWSAAQLLGSTGDVDGLVRSAHTGTKPGFLTNGPQWRVESGRYRLSVRYRATSTDGTAPGYLEIFARSHWKSIDQFDLLPTAGEWTEKSYDFDVSRSLTGRLEFRTMYEGSDDLAVEWIRIEPSPDQRS